MKLIIKKHDSERDFIVIFYVWFLVSLIGMTNLDQVLDINISFLNDLVDYATLFLLVVRIIFMQKYTLNEIIKIAVIGGVVLISAICSGESALIATLIFVVAAKEVDIYKIIRLVYRTLIVFVPLVILMGILGVIPSVVVYTSRLIGGGVRTSLGFYHPNALGMIVFELYVLYMLIHKDCIRWWSYLLGIGCFIFVYAVPNSQTSFVAIFLFMCLISIERRLSRNKQEKALTVFGTILIVGILFINLFCVLFTVVDIHKNKWLSMLDTVFTYRFFYAYRSYEYYGIRVWGQPTNFLSDYTSSGLRLICDNSYAHLLIGYGIMGYLVFNVAYMLMMLYLRKRNNYVWLVIFFVYAVYGIMESNFFVLKTNLFLLAMSKLLYMRGAAFNNLEGVQGDI